jgi:hypothetical protein
VNRSKTKTSNFFLSIIENDFDLIILVETNFDSSIKNEEVFGNRYCCDRLLGQNSIISSGDGVAIAIKRQFDSAKCPASTISCEEI